MSWEQWFLTFGGLLAALVVVVLWIRARNERRFFGEGRHDPVKVFCAFCEGYPAIYYPRRGLLSCRVCYKHGFVTEHPEAITQRNLP